MNRINILEAEVFNKIAAGEVVEKPASIVKELVENSLDAGATDILIEIESGGIEKIKVVDNGFGIHPQDVKTAFLPHTTSKIKNVDDLTAISTLGFRGEALASIASVSKVKLATKQNAFEMGKIIEIEGGIVKNFSDTAKNNGTTLEVSELFYNIPARKKFLRKPKTEESEITNLVVRYILANPTIKFTYIVDKQIVYKTTGTNLEDAIYVVYKINAKENLLKVDYKLDNIQISGYISKPTLTKSNRTYQTLIVNGRYVVNNLISTCIQSSYQNFLMKGQFPLYVLNFNLPLSSLDVNVHPNKLDVKFENTQKIYGYFYSAISKALLDFSEVKKADYSLFEKITTKPEKPNFVGKSFSEEILEPKSFNTENSIKTYKEFEAMSTTNKEFHDSPIMANIINKAVEQQKVLKELQTEIKEVEIFSKNEQFQTEVKENITTKAQVFENINTLNYKIIGTVFNTYILLEMNDSIFVLDQHACHERLNYDKLIKELEQKNLSIQPLLLPYVLETNVLETNFILENLSSLQELGFTVNEFGQNAFKVSTIPSVLYNINLADFFKEILSDLNAFKKVTTKDILKEKLSQKACKASVKAGDKLSNQDIEILLNQMINSNMTLACPHGRPAIIEITKNEIEKSFKRKV